MLRKSIKINTLQWMQKFIFQFTEKTPPEVKSSRINYLVAEINECLKELEKLSK